MFCHSNEECLECVEEERADLALVNALRQEARDSVGADGELVIVRANAVSMDLCLGMSRENDKLLKSILNKGIKKVEWHDIEQCVFDNVLDAQPGISLDYLIRSYPLQALLCVTAVFIIFVFLGIFYTHGRMNKKQNRMLLEKNNELKAAIEIQHRLQRESEQDPLTGLKNKGAIEKMCEEKLAFAKEKSYTLLMADVDDFKHVNDT